MRNKFYDSVGMDTGNCPRCKYGFTRYARLMSRPLYIPGEPCPSCGVLSDLLDLGEDFAHIASVLQSAQGVDELTDRLHPVPIPKPVVRGNDMRKGTVWRHKVGQLFVVIQGTDTNTVEILWDPKHHHGQGRLHLSKSEFLRLFECVAGPPAPTTRFFGVVAV